MATLAALRPSPSEKTHEKAKRWRLTVRVLPAADVANATLYRSFCRTARRRMVVTVRAVISELCGKMSGPSNRARPQAWGLATSVSPVDALFHGGALSAIAPSASSTDKAT